MPNQRHVIMVAAEDAALSGAKVGGVADVLFELPLALADGGWKCTILIPSYGFLHTKNPSKLIDTVAFPFRGEALTAEFWETTSKQPHPLVNIIIVHHPLISGEPIYYNDPPDRPFERDASKYALFCSAVGKFLEHRSFEGVLHLHDWHAAMLLLLRDVHPGFAYLQRLKTIYTIHNLAIQGTRPMRVGNSSVEAWFPELFHRQDWIERWKDPRVSTWLFTPMDAGIRFADNVNTVSETYAKEILLPSNHENGFSGGEGLEGALQHAMAQGRLFGILNGCQYPEQRLPISSEDRQAEKHRILQHIIDEITSHRVQLGGLSYDDSVKRLQWFIEKDIHFSLTSVTRITEQKMRLLCEKDYLGTIALDSIAATLDEQNGLYIIIGTGTPDYETVISESSRNHERIIYVQGYSESLSQTLYSNGTMFLMPSLYEPCGISQMIAMREGQPCIVHGVGGLRDTVWHDVNGFVFEGWTMQDKVNNLVTTVRHAIHVVLQYKDKWNSIKQAARAARFDWATAAKKYEMMYLS